MAVDLNAIAESIIMGNKTGAVTMTQQAIDEGVTAQQVLNNGLIAGMNVVGQKFKCNEFYVPEVLIAARAMKECMALLKPLLMKSGVESAGKILIGTIKGDLHDIGKNLVGMMLEGSGFEVIDLGVDIKPDAFVQSVKETNADIVGMSALLTTTMPVMKDTIQALEAAGLRNGVKILIGGAPVTQSFAEEIGADGYAPDAATAVELARELVKAA